MKFKSKGSVLFDALLILASSYALITAFIRNGSNFGMDVVLFILSFAAAVICSMMMVLVDLGNNGYVDFTDSIVAFVFIVFGTESAIIFASIYILASEFIKIKYIKMYRSKYHRALKNYFMFITSYYIAALLTNRIFKGIAFENYFGIIVMTFVYLLIFLIFNLAILSIRNYFEKGELLKFNNEAREMLILNLFASNLLAVIQCIVYDTSGKLGMILIYTNFIILNYCFYIYRKLELRNRDMKGLLTITRDLAKYGDFTLKCSHLISNLKDIIPYNVCAIYVLEPNKDIVYPIAYGGDIDLSELSFIKTEESLTIKKVMEGKVYISYDVEGDNNIGFRGKLKAIVTSAVFVPINIEGKTVGSVFIGGDSQLSGFLSTGADDFLNLLSAQLSLSLENNKIFEVVKSSAELDPLTRLYNRRVFDREVNELIENNVPFSLALFDIDDFKVVNDTYGHTAGDEILKNISNIFRCAVRKSDILCRYGGEEFVVILKNLNKEDSLIITDRLRKGIENMATLHFGKVIKVTISGGVSSFPEDGTTLTELLNKADKALYLECKGKGKNKVATYGT